MKYASLRFVLAVALIQNAFIQNANAQITNTETFNLIVENDAIHNTDYHYTSGILLDYVADWNKTPEAVLDLANQLPLIESNDRIHMGLHLGQQIFTPNDIQTDQVIPDERPYAGYLFGGISLLAVSPGDLHMWTFDVGVVGPAARAQEFQSSIHGRLGVNPPRGWDNQLDNETIFQFDYRRTWRQRWTYIGGRFAADLMPNAGLALGNAFTHADAGVTLRIGQGLNSDFGPPRMQPSLSSSSLPQPRGLGWYVFTGFGARYVAHNIFLDGNKHAPSHSVDKYNWVGDLQAGLVLNTRNYRLAYTFVGRSHEYKSQKNSDQFGSLTLSVKF